MRVHERGIRGLAIHGLPRATLDLDDVADDRCTARLAPAVRVVTGLHDRGQRGARVYVGDLWVGRTIFLAIRFLAMHASRHTFERATVKHFRGSCRVWNSWLEAHVGLLD